MAGSLPFVRVQTSRRQRYCEVASCHHGDDRIARGDRYARLVLPPHWDVNGSDRWWPLIGHVDCLGVEDPTHATG